MLINGKRELAYIVTIDEIAPIPNYDRVEHARVNGWWVIVKKDQFKVGDKAIYIEVDSRVPETEPFEFLEKRNYKVKTIKMCKVLSQGLLMELSDFDWDNADLEVGQPVTDALGITYADAEDNKRKANSEDKYKKMAQRRPDIFKRSWARWFMRREWGRKLMFALFGRKKDRKNGWPAEVAKTDEERVQNMPWIANDRGLWIATEKVDGSSSTYHMRRKKKEFFVCSRNVVQTDPEKPCYYDSNIYWEMAYKYNLKDFLKAMLEKHPSAEWVTLQGEVYGEGVQKRTYGLGGRAFAGFNLIFSDTGRMNSAEMAEVLKEYKIPSVPILGEVHLPETVEGILEMADAEASMIDGGMREGIVFRSIDGTRSFKAVSNNFLLKYHA